MIIEATPDRLREVDGIGPVRASRIAIAGPPPIVLIVFQVFGKPIEHCLRANNEASPELVVNSDLSAAEELGVGVC